jgi:hypothetical protein
MVSEYLSFKPPTQVGMRMVEGPPFFASFSGGWSFKPLGPDRTEATWRYSFSIRPAWLGRVADPDRPLVPRARQTQAPRRLRHRLRRPGLP